MPLTESQFNPASLWPPVTEFVPKFHSNFAESYADLVSKGMPAGGEGSVHLRDGAWKVVVVGGGDPGWSYVDYDPKIHELAANKARRYGPGANYGKGEDRQNIIEYMRVLRGVELKDGTQPFYDALFHPTLFETLRIEYLARFGVPQQPPTVTPPVVTPPPAGALVRVKEDALFLVTTHPTGAGAPLRTWAAAAFKKLQEFSKLTPLLLLCLLPLLSGCRSSGLSTPSAGLCSGVGAIQALCAAPGEKPKAIAQVCDQSGVILLLCGPSSSAPPAVCPPPLPVGCISGVLSSQESRLMTSTKRSLLAECAGYLAAVQQCAASKPVG